MRGEAVVGRVDAHNNDIGFGNGWLPCVGLRNVEDRGVAPERTRHLLSLLAVSSGYPNAEVRLCMQLLSNQLSDMAVSDDQDMFCGLSRACRPPSSHRLNRPIHADYGPDLQSRRAAAISATTNIDAMKIR